MSEKPTSLHEQILTQSAAGLIFSIVQLLRNGGLETSAALRLAAFRVLEEAYGESVYDVLEISRSTRLRYRREMREALKTMPTETSDFVNESMHQVVDLLTKKMS